MGIKNAKNQTPQTRADFEPSIKTLLRILKTISENQSIGKTNLSLSTNLNYDRLSKHILWLEQKGFVRSIVSEGKIHFTLTSNGTHFAEIIS